jgi:hypothetical protein
MDAKAQEYCISKSKWRAGGFFGALLSIIAIFFIVPVFEKNFYTHLILQCSFILLIFSTIFAIEGQRSILISGLFCLIPFIYFDSLSFQYHSLLYMIIAYGFSLVFTLFAIIFLMRRILGAYLVNADLIFAALMVYLLSGILWANFYFLENIISPGCFHGAGTLNFGSTAFLDTYEQQFNFLYYSFATLATLGMGDITPLDHLAKSLTALEAMFGQLFVAIIIAKLVSVWWHVPGKRNELS